MKKLRRFYSDTKNGISNLIKWFPVVWSDRDYDWNPLVRIIAFKLDSMSNFHKDKGYSVDSDKTANKLKYLSRLAREIAEEDYTEVAFLDKMYLLKKQEMIIKPLNDESDNSSLEFEGLSKDEEKELMSLYKLEDELLQEDIDYLFDEMKKNLRGWWD